MLKKTSTTKKTAGKATAKKSTAAKKASAKEVPSDPVAFMAALDHPLKTEVEALRMIVTSADRSLVEEIKEQAPSYAKDGKDRITFNLDSPDRVRLVFHRGAAAGRPKGAGHLITDVSGLLEWPASDRAVASFGNMIEVDSARAALRKIVKTWLAAAARS